MCNSVMSWAVKLTPYSSSYLSGGVGGAVCRNALFTLCIHLVRTHKHALNVNFSRPNRITYWHNVWIFSVMSCETNKLYISNVSICLSSNKYLKQIIYVSKFLAINFYKNLNQSFSEFVQNIQKVKSLISAELAKY